MCMAKEIEVKEVLTEEEEKKLLEGVWGRPYSKLEEMFGPY